MPKTEGVSVRNTKQEIIRAYKEVLEDLKAREKESLQPETIKEEKQKKEILTRVDSMAETKITENIIRLKNQISEALAEISEKLERENLSYAQLKTAIELKQKEINELYEIETEAGTLAALIEGHKKIKETQKTEYENEKNRLNKDISDCRRQWQLEKESYELEQSERKLELKKKREREEEEYAYKTSRDREQEQNLFKDEQEQLKKELISQRAEFEARVAEKDKELETREKNLKENELRYQELERKIASYENDLNKAVEREVTLTVERMSNEFKVREELLKQQATGEKNVMKTRIEGLEQALEQQKALIERLSAQVENSYRKVEDIALKALDSEKRKAHSAAEFQFKEKQTGSNES